MSHKHHRTRKCMRKKPTGAYENIRIYYIGLVVFVTYPLKKHLPDDGHKRWPKHVWGS